MEKSVLITGMTGQDGSYLAELLLARGDKVHGLSRRDISANNDCPLIPPAAFSRIHWHVATIEEYASLRDAIAQVKPDELYHLAAQSVVNHSPEAASSTLATNIQGTQHILEAVLEVVPECRVCIAGSCQMFDDRETPPYSESSPRQPRNIYGISKQAAFELTRYYREERGLHCGTAILFNHESPRRGRQFVTRKISRAAASIKLGKSSSFSLGNLGACRDWGFAGDYVDGMARMLTLPSGDDFVFATGVGHTVEDFAARAFECVDLEFRDYLEVDESLLRTTDSRRMIGDINKAKQKLDWSPSVNFEELVKMMVEHDLNDLQRNEK
ncbi:GDP-mannose 4,6-dehydratase [Calycomorphotria hydatis]|uniref:GDP-mannose 4,6-dehydratase n=1 Tax=Calycomorphotria hydatis TaxID=2528027 RepID=A0A517T5K9_9PLAN|nr:GDP-mannose 4,6-dehydratase [Calycomorphotria hydatis]QDT63648.1 GDP-mannose 4,6-dehydratase [Calycomorphotria hydatis]